MAVDDSYTKLLLHMDGADNGTTFTDEAGKTVTPAGNVCTKIAQKVFGTASAYFDGNGDYLTLADSDDWYFGTGDFTIDFWIYPLQLQNYDYLIDQYADANNRWLICHDANGALYFQVVSGGNNKAFYQTANSKIKINQWQHVAIVRNGTSAGCLKMYVNGVDVTPTPGTDLANNAIPNLSTLLRIGVDAVNYYFYGYMDELRISKGIARWTTNFISPIAPYISSETPVDLLADTTSTSAINATVTRSISLLCEINDQMSAMAILTCLVSLEGGTAELSEITVDLLGGLTRISLKGDVTSQSVTTGALSYACSLNSDIHTGISITALVKRAFNLWGAVISQSTISVLLHRAVQIRCSVVEQIIIEGTLHTIYETALYVSINTTLSSKPSNTYSFMIQLEGTTNMEVSAALISRLAITLSAIAELIPIGLQNRWFKGDVLGISTAEAELARTNQATVDLSGLTFLYLGSTKITQGAGHLAGTSALYCSTEISLGDAINANTRQIYSRMEIYFDGLSQAPVSLTKDIVMSAKLLEELKADTGKPLGAVSSNVLTLSILNLNGMFTPTNTAGPYHGKLVPQVPIKAYIIIRVGSADIEVALGTFYSSDWKSPNSTLETSLTCYDKLYTLAQKELPAVKMQRDTTIKRLFVLIFDLLGLSSEEYNVSAELDIPLAYGWLPQGTVGTALQWLAEACFGIVFMDRYNIIQVQRLDFTQAPIFILTGDTQIQDSDIPTRYNDIYSVLNMNYYIPELGNPESLVNLTDITIPPGTTTFTAVAFSKGPVALVSYAGITGTADVTIRVTKNTSWDIDLEIVNPGTEVKGTITVFGKVINPVCIPIRYEDVELRGIIGEKIYKVENQLIQNAIYAGQYATNMFQLVTNPNGVVQTTIRGNPQIELGETVTIRDDSSKAANVNAIVIRTELDFATGLEGTLEGVVVSEL